MCFQGGKYVYSLIKMVNTVCYYKIERGVQSTFHEPRYPGREVARLPHLRSCPSCFPSSMTNLCATQRNRVLAPHCRSCSVDSQIYIFFWNHTAVKLTPVSWEKKMSTEAFVFSMTNAELSFVFWPYYPLCHIPTTAVVGYLLLLLCRWVPSLVRGRHIRSDYCPQKNSRGMAGASTFSFSPRCLVFAAVSPRR